MRRQIVHVDSAHEPVAQAVLAALYGFLNAAPWSIDSRRAQNKGRPSSFRDSPLDFQARSCRFRARVDGRSFIHDTRRSIDCGRGQVHDPARIIS